MMSSTKWKKPYPNHILCQLSCNMITIFEIVIIFSFLVYMKAHPNYHFNEINFAEIIVDAIFPSIITCLLYVGMFYFKCYLQKSHSYILFDLPVKELLVVIPLLTAYMKLKDIACDIGPIKTNSFMGNVLTLDINEIFVVEYNCIIREVKTLSRKIKLVVIPHVNESHDKVVELHKHIEIALESIIENIVERDPTLCEKICRKFEAWIAK